MALRIIAQVGDPTIIINNAGVVKGKLLLDLTEEDITESVTILSFHVASTILMR